MIRIECLSRLQGEASPDYRSLVSIDPGHMVIAPWMSERDAIVAAFLGSWLMRNEGNPPGFSTHHIAVLPGAITSIPIPHSLPFEPDLRAQVDREHVLLDGAEIEHRSIAVDHLPLCKPYMVPDVETAFTSKLLNWHPLKDHADPQSAHFDRQLFHWGVVVGMVEATCPLALTDEANMSTDLMELVIHWTTEARNRRLGLRRMSNVMDGVSLYHLHAHGLLLHERAFEPSRRFLSQAWSRWANRFPGPAREIGRRMALAIASVPKFMAQLAIYSAEQQCNLCSRSSHGPRPQSAHEKLAAQGLSERIRVMADEIVEELIPLPAA